MHDDGKGVVGNDYFFYFLACGTGVGISALLDGTTDIAMASRPIKFSEKMKVKSAGKEVEEVIVAYDALAVVVHPSNPVKLMSGVTCPAFSVL